MEENLTIRILRVTSESGDQSDYPKGLIAKDLWDLDACLRDKAKLQRAYGECLGSQKR